VIDRITSEASKKTELQRNVVFTSFCVDLLNAKYTLGLYAIGVGVHVWRMFLGSA
jgi:hypothetical protein